jgi:hypothetical protein
LKIDIQEEAVFHILKKEIQRSERMAHICNPSTQQVETRGLQVLGPPELHNKILSHSKNVDIIV